mmetsp:Transcript_27068/g.81978  ORF Transcript_27068/g.81978 Transcript_27068/m.81978 type:complete len:254 (+) Transcript_27068:2435-3196(+)|eukprot:scaffold153469_cov32-Tisochrysis_lutea.AAC.3
MSQEESGAPTLMTTGASVSSSAPRPLCCASSLMVAKQTPELLEALKISSTCSSTNAAPTFGCRRSPSKVRMSIGRCCDSPPPCPRRLPSVWGRATTPSRLLMSVVIWRLEGSLLEEAKLRKEASTARAKAFVREETHNTTTKLRVPTPSLGDGRLKPENRSDLLSSTRGSCSPSLQVDSSSCASSNTESTKLACLGISSAMPLASSSLTVLEFLSHSPGAIGQRALPKGCCQEVSTSPGAIGCLAKRWPSRTA